MGRHQVDRDLDAEQFRLVVAFLGAPTAKLPELARMPGNVTPYQRKLTSLAVSSNAESFRCLKIAVSDRRTLRGLPQFARESDPSSVAKCRFAEGSPPVQTRRRVLRYTVPDRPQLVDSKAERCRSGRSSTLGKRSSPAALTHSNARQRTRDQRLNPPERSLDVRP